MRSSWKTRLGCAALIVAAAGGVALAAGTQGSQSNPLVTLSYLNEVAVPDILKQVEEKMAARESELEGQAAVPFAVVEVQAGKTVTLFTGSQILLRSGSAYGSPLLDVTDGTTLSGTGVLTANHLYLATGDGQTVTASGACTVMIQGSYSVN